MRRSTTICRWRTSAADGHAGVRRDSAHRLQLAASTWVSTGALVDRMNFSLSLAANRLPGITVNWTPLPDLASDEAQPEPTPEQEELRLEPLMWPAV